MLDEKLSLKTRQQHLRNPRIIKSCRHIHTASICYRNVENLSLEFAILGFYLFSKKEKIRFFQFHYQDNFEFR